MKHVFASEADKDTFKNLVESAVDVNGAKKVEVQIDGKRDILWVNINDVCVLRVCKVQEFAIEQVSKP